MPWPLHRQDRADGAQGRWRPPARASLQPGAGPQPQGARLHRKAPLQVGLPRQPHFEGILGEEGDGNKELSDGYCFIIDPIDGTTNFIKGFQHSAISVGLAKDKELILGVVLDPDLDNIYYAERGKGAYLNSKRIHVSDCDLQNSLVLFGTCPYEHELARKTFALTEQVFYNCLEVRRSGSAALDICYVAAGKADLYYELILRPWDMAGATMILKEAGGICRTLDKKEVDCEHIQSYVCGSNKNIEEFFRIADEIL